MLISGKFELANEEKVVINEILDTIRCTLKVRSSAKLIASRRVNTRAVEQQHYLVN